METWKPIPKYNGKYEVSDKGNVRSLCCGRIKTLKQMFNAGKYNGYPVVTLYDNEHRAKKEKVHRLVAEAFIPNPQRLPLINHKDEDKCNNCVDNLEWCTKQYNNSYNGANSRRSESLKAWYRMKKGTVRAS
ncbi:MAG: NUMOD4 domain-containing protein [Acutalibacteraceae bacterium]